MSETVTNTWKVERSWDVPCYFWVDSNNGRNWVGASLSLHYNDADNYTWRLNARSTNADIDFIAARPAFSLPNISIEDAKKWAESAIAAWRTAVFC